MLVYLINFYRYFRCANSSLIRHLLYHAVSVRPSVSVAAVNQSEKYLTFPE